jgi:hypothetical protein
MKSAQFHQWGLAALGLVMSGLLTQCSTDRLAGGTIETTNGIVAGTVAKEDGNAAARTVVQLIPENYDPIHDSIVIEKDTTDSEGQYSFTKVKDGRYNIVSTQLGTRTRAFARDIQVYKDTVNVTMQILKPTGCVKVAFEDSDSANRFDSIENHYVYIPGTGISAFLKGKSRVVLDSVPMGEFTIIRSGTTTSSTASILREGMRVITADTTTVFNPGWKFAKSIVLNTSPRGANISNNVLDFPVLVRLSPTNFDFSRAAVDGKDIRFTNKNGQSLPHEIDHWDTENQQAEIWVRVDTVYGNNSSLSLVLYSGNSRVELVSKRGPVFDTAQGFQGVWHMGATDSKTEFDATENRYDGTVYGMTEVNRVKGMVGMAKRFDGSSSFIQIMGSASSKLNFGEGSAYSLSAWVAIDSGTNHPELILGKGHSQYYLRKNYYTNTTYWELVEYRNVEKKLHICEAPATPAYSWKYIVAVSSGNKQSLYVNGELVMDTTRLNAFSQGISVTDSSYDLTFGKHLQPTSAEGDCFFKGIIDEIRVSNIAYNADWVKLNYLNQRVNANWLEFP